MPIDLAQVMAALGHSRLSRSLSIPASLQSRTIVNWRNQPEATIALLADKIAPNMDSLNALGARVKGIVVIYELMHQIVWEIRAVVDDVGLPDRENGITSATRFRGQESMAADWQKLWPGFKIFPRNIERRG
jgi:hypothetical protein